MRRVGTLAAATAALVFAFATPMWSVAANALWTHTVTTLGITGMAWASDRQRWWLVGVFGGIALWGRVHVSLIVAVLGLGLAYYHRRPAIAILVGGVSGLAMGLATLWTRWVYGTWSPTGGYSAPGYLSRVQDGFHDTWNERIANEFGLWFSADRGIFVWTPVLLLLVLALIRSWRGLPRWSTVLLAGGLLYTCVQGWFSGFHGGDTFFSYRLGLEFLACATPAFVMAVASAGAFARALLGPVLGLQFGMIGIGAVTDYMYLPVSAAWSQNSLLVAVREQPTLTVLLFLCVMIGALAQRVWNDRRATQNDPVAVTSPTKEPTGVS